MKVSAISNAYKNVSFGHISTNAVNAIRKATEGYEESFSYDSNDFYHKNPSLNEFYAVRKNDTNKFNSEQIQRFDELVERASKLKTVIIGTKERDYQLTLAVRNGKGRYILIKYPRELNKRGCVTYNLNYGNPEYNLDVLQKAVEDAEIIEESGLFPDCKVKVEEKFQNLTQNRVQKEFSNIYKNALYIDYRH